MQQLPDTIGRDRRPALWWVRLVIVVALESAAAQNQVAPTLISRASLRYPPLARQARIQGQIHLEFFINHHGEVASVNVLSGHPMLAPAAADNVQSWKFVLPKAATLDDQRYETIFDFEISTADVELPLDDNAVVTVDSFRHVRVITTSLMIGGGDPRRSGCPSQKQTQPPSNQNAADYVEMSRSGCLGTCPVYTVRIHANGIVDWDGESYVKEKRKDSSDIGSSLARDLISKFSSPEFWKLCASYSDSVTDNATTAFRVSIGGLTKTVSNYANSAPPWVNDLEYAIDELVDTHHWLHGDPRDEPLSRIQEDAYIPKHGVTPLMRAAARADAEKVKALLTDGADAVQTDSSGWTALMYARRESCGALACIDDSEVFKLLIAAGANPNYVSPHGDTALMASAFDGHFEQSLAKAGGQVNAQNADGVSTLMILASKAEASEIKNALLSGADAKLKDTQGRTALDYLRLANCGQSPLRDSIREQTSENNQCDLNDEDFRKSKKLLDAATRLTAP
jgi:TonB family protein